jgi:hypothetical protein
MKRIWFLAMTMVIGLGILSMLGCPADNGGNGNGAYFLNVSVGEGVNGNPVSGAYSYNLNDVVSYSYSLKSGYKNLLVRLDGASVAFTGIVIIAGNHSLTATADQFDVRGNWTGRIYDANNFDLFDITFSGSSPASGTTNGGIKGGAVGSGTFTATGDQVSFTVVYGFGTFNFNGTMTTENRIDGTYTWSNDPGNTWTFYFDRI